VLIQTPFVRFQRYTFINLTDGYATTSNALIYNTVFAGVIEIAEDELERRELGKNGLNFGLYYVSLKSKC